MRNIKYTLLALGFISCSYNLHAGGAVGTLKTKTEQANPAEVIPQEIITAIADYKRQNSIDKSVNFFAARSPRDASLTKMITHDGKTFPPIAFVAYSNNYLVAQELLKHGVPVDVPDKGGFTALFWATKADNFEFIKLLLEHGADPDRGMFDAALDIRNTPRSWLRQHSNPKRTRTERITNYFDASANYRADRAESLTHTSAVARELPTELQTDLVAIIQAYLAYRSLESYAREIYDKQHANKLVRK